MLAVRRQVVRKVIRLGRARVERQGMFQDAHAIDTDVDCAAAGPFQKVDLKMIANRLQPDAFVRFVGAETETGKAVKPVVRRIFSHTIDSPTRTCATISAAARRTK